MWTKREAHYVNVVYTFIRQNERHAAEGSVRMPVKQTGLSAASRNYTDMVSTFMRGVIKQIILKRRHVVVLKADLSMSSPSKHDLV